MDIFDLSAKIRLDTSEFEKGVQSASGSMDGLSTKAVALGNAIYDIGKKAAEGFENIVKEAVGGYADFEQLVGGVNKLFGEASGTLQEYAAAAFETAGLSKNKYMETVTGFAASLVNSLGGDTKAAADYADMAITDMADNANTFGTSMSSLQATYQAFAKQNYSLLDNLKLGFGGSQQEMYRLLQTAQELEPSFDAVFSMDAKGHLTAEFADIVEAIHIVQEDMGILGTTANESASTVSGSVATMKGAWENWLVGLGDPNADMSALTDNLVDSVQTAWGNIEPVLGQIKTNLAEAFTSLTGIDLSGVTSQFSGLSESVIGFINPLVDTLQENGLSEMFDQLLSQFQEMTGFDLSPFTKGIETLFASLDGLMSGGASEALSVYVDKISELVGIDLSEIQSAFERFGEAIDNVAAAFANGGIDSAVSELFTQLDDLTGLDVSGFFDDLKKSYDDVATSFEEGGLTGGISAIWEAFEEAGPKIKESGETILTNVGDIISGIGEYIYTHLPENIQTLIDSIGGAFRAVREYLAAVWEDIKPFATFIGETLVNGFLAVWENIKNGFSTVVTLLTGGFELIQGLFQILTGVMTLDFEKAAEGIKTAFSGIGRFFSGIVDDIKRAFSGIVEWFSDIGSRMWEGLKSGFSAAVDGVKEIGEKVLTGFKKLFGINSPSRVFAEYGKYMAQGLENGWNGEIDSVVGSMSDALKVRGSVDFASSALGKSSSAQINTMLSGMSERGGNYNINLVVDGRTLANVVFDPLIAVSKQKGVAIGA